MQSREKHIEALIESIHDLRRVIVSYLDFIYNQYNINFRQLLSLQLIEREQIVSVKQLSESLGITSSAATQMVDVLVKKGYLSREESARDRRLMDVMLTSEGRDLLRVIQQDIRGKQKHLFEQFSDDEIVQFIQLIRKTVETIESGNEINQRLVSTNESHG